MSYNIFIEIAVCKPSPCKNDGICSIVTDTEYLCNCSNTGYSGKNCEQLIVDVAPIPKMYATIKSAAISLTCQPKSYVDIMLFEVDNVVSFNNSKHTITSNSKRSEFTVYSSKAGLFWLKFDVKSEESVLPLKDRLLFFNSAGPVNKINGKSLLGFENGCYITDIYQKHCDKSIKFSSTAWWEKTQTGILHTTGIVYMKIKSQTFPILLSKLSVSEFLNDVKTKISISINKQPSIEGCAEMKVSHEQI